MTLDLKALASQVRSMSSRLIESGSDLAARYEILLAKFDSLSGQVTKIAEKVDRSADSCTWLLAKPVEPVETKHSLPSVPARYTVLAADGSQLDSDRHEMPMCYLVNIGTSVINYGAPSSASLNAQPRLFYEPEDLFIEDGVHKVPVQGSRLAAKRDVEECGALVEIAHSAERDRPVVALVDGTLIRWTLESAEAFVRDKFLRQYLAHLEMLREMNVPVAGYISRPGSSEIVGTLKVSICPDETARCNRCSSRIETGTPACEIIDGFADRNLFDHLQEGERSGLFSSMSRINVHEYGEHRVHFFYMAVGGELARVETPQWVGASQEMLDLVHAVLYAQGLKGQGYPVALARAHEKAVITAGDRRSFLDLMHTLLEREGVGIRRSRKNISKQSVSL